MAAYLDRQAAAQRAGSIIAVVLFHVALIAMLITQSRTTQAFLPALAPVLVLPGTRPKPPPPPPVKPVLPPPPDLLPIPVPEIAVAPPPPSAAMPRAVARAAPAPAQTPHFGAAGADTGLGIEAATSAGGGARGRGALGDFDAAVKHAILARKSQPFLAWDRRNTCVVNYQVNVAADGSLAGFSISPCAVPEINEAARQAIRAAAPFPRPPDLGGAATSVHGTLIFHP